MKTKILMIDDDMPFDDESPLANYMWYYADRLKQNHYNVTRATGPDPALELLSAAPNGFDLIVLDVMMPPGRFADDKEAEQGSRTGVCLADKFRESYPRIPIVVLTNAVDEESLGALRANPSVRVILCKPDCLPSALVAEVEAILNR